MKQIRQNRVSSYSEIEASVQTWVKVEAKKIIESAMYEMSSTRIEQVNKFTYDIKGGFWLSTKFAV